MDFWPLWSNAILTWFSCRFGQPANKCGFLAVLVKQAYQHIFLPFRSTGIPTWFSCRFGQTGIPTWFSCRFGHTTNINGFLPD